MTTLWRVVISLFVFAIAYSVSYLVTGWLVIYVLDSWDPKFHNQAGNFALHRSILPVFLVVATLSHSLGLYYQWLWLRAAPLWVVISLEALIPTLALSFAFTLAFASEYFPTRSIAVDLLGGVSIFLNIFGPAILTFLIPGLVRKRVKAWISTRAV